MVNNTIVPIMPLSDLDTIFVSQYTKDDTDLYEYSTHVLHMIVRSNNYNDEILPAYADRLISLHTEKNSDFSATIDIQFDNSDKALDDKFDTGSVISLAAYITGLDEEATEHTDILPIGVYVITERDTADGIISITGNNIKYVLDDINLNGVVLNQNEDDQKLYHLFGLYDVPIYEPINADSRVLGHYNQSLTLPNISLSQFLEYADMSAFAIDNDERVGINNESQIVANVRYPELPLSLPISSQLGEKELVSTKQYNYAIIQTAKNAATYADYRTEVEEARVLTIDNEFIDLTYNNPEDYVLPHQNRDIYSILTDVAWIPLLNIDIGQKIEIFYGNGILEYDLGIITKISYDYEGGLFCTLEYVAEDEPTCSTGTQSVTTAGRIGDKASAVSDLIEEKTTQYATTAQLTAETTARSNADTTLDNKFKVRYVVLNGVDKTNGYSWIKWSDGTFDVYGNMQVVSGQTWYTIPLPWAVAYNNYHVQVTFDDMGTSFLWTYVVHLAGRTTTSFNLFVSAGGGGPTATPQLMYHVHGYY